MFACRCLSVEGLAFLIYHDNFKIVISVSESQMLAWMSPSVEGSDILIQHDNITIS